VLLAALLLPVLLALRVAGDLHAGMTISLRYRVLLVVSGTRVLRTPRRASASPAAASADPASGPGPGHSRGARGRALWTQLELAQRVLRSRAVRVARPQGWLEFALGDVAETGRLYGFACMLAALVDPEGGLEILPLWNAEEWLAADLSLRARVHPLLLAVVLIRARLARGRIESATAATAPEQRGHAA